MCSCGVFVDVAFELLAVRSVLTARFGVLVLVAVAQLASSRLVTGIFTVSLVLVATAQLASRIVMDSKCG
jgi:hypothetical protein